MKDYVEVANDNVMRFPNGFGIRFANPEDAEKALDAVGDFAKDAFKSGQIKGFIGGAILAVALIGTYHLWKKLDKEAINHCH